MFTLHPRPRPPAAGPNASPIERARATGALRELRAGRSAKRWLLRQSGDEDENREKATANLFAFGSGLSAEEAEEALEAIENE